ncbi:tetratricopeptide repeat protein 41-like [Spea bombifrons]|uniref:tetratricopeptide repeat protein 41-like n=1 Tax=Spea bombifrons TaxID=233779 RepID=UPI00234B3531|nr:tetratricopeptide repeat protein 41-like [Spea bombifrons]
MTQVFIEEQKDSYYYFTHRPHIRPYVCSTVKDFQEERNYLAHHVFPQLNNFSVSRGTSFKPIDMRWTLEESTDVKSAVLEQSHLVSSMQLKLRLDYINSSSPFFICLLGHTYGEYVPETENGRLAVVSDVPDFRSLSRVEQNLIVAAKNGYRWVLEEDHSHRSLTELEIIQAVFLQDTKFHYFYFRDYNFIDQELQKANGNEKKASMSTCTAANEHEETKIWELKTRIVDRGLPVKFFKTKEELGQLVLKDWCDVIEKVYPLSAVPANLGHEYSLAQAYHEAFAEGLCKGFVSNEQLTKLLTILDTFAFSALRKEQSPYLITSEDISDVRFFNGASSRSPSAAELKKSILLLQGVRGCGKSTLVAKWLCLFRKYDPDVTVIPYFAGSNGRRNDIISFMRHCITQLQGEYFGTDSQDACSGENITDGFEFPLVVEAFLASIALKPCVLLLDGIDELSGIRGLAAEQAKGFTWLPVNLPRHCKIIMTTNKSHLSYKYMKERIDVQMIELEALSGDVGLEIIKKQLAISDKQIAPDQLESIVNKKGKITPLQLAVLASELCLYSQYMFESSSVDDYLDALTTEQMWSFLIERWVKDYSWTYEKPKKKKKANQILANTALAEMKGWVVDVLCLLSISRCGLGDDDILQLLKNMGYQDHFEVTSIHWAAFRSAASKWIEEKPDGLLHFCHQSCRYAVDHLFLGITMPVSYSLDNYFQNTMNHKRKRYHQLLIKYFQQMDLSRRVFEEVSWHLKMIGNLSEMYRFLTNARTLDLVYRSTRVGYEMKMDLIRSWKFLLASGNDPAVECEKMMDSRRAMNEDISEMAEYGSVICFAAQCLKDIGKTNQAEEILSFLESHLEKCTLDKKSTEVLMRTQKSIADLYRDSGSWPKASMYYQKALQGFQGFTPEDLENNEQLLKLQGRLKCHLALSNAIQFSGQLRQALEDAISHFQLFSPDPYEQAVLQLCQGLYKFSVGNFSESEKHLCESYNIRCNLHGKRHVLTGEVQEYLADLKSHPRNDTYSHRLQALEIYKEVISIKESAEELSQSVEIKDNLKLSLSTTLFKSGILLCQADFRGCKEAIGILQRSLDLRTRILGLDHPLSREVQCCLKKVKYVVRCGKGQFKCERSPCVMENIYTLDDGRLSNISPPTYHHDMEFHRTNPEALNSSTERNSNEILTHSKWRAKTAPTTVLEKRKLLGTQVLSNQGDSNSGEDGCGKLAPVSPITAFKGKRLGPLPSRAKSAPVSHPTTVCQTVISGPLSSITALDTFSSPVSRSKEHRLTHKSAWYHVPGRYPTLHTPYPPKRHQIPDWV